MVDAKSSLPPSSFSSSSSSSSQWGPYNNGGDFTAIMGILLVILFCSLLFALGLNALIRYLLCSLRQRTNSEPNQKSLALELPASFPTSVFSRTTKLAGTVAECSVCLAEFVDGDKVRVLPSCNHGFHVGCVEKWILTNKSCPTCRAGYQLDVV